jgi:hypothetical protein
MPHDINLATNGRWRSADPAADPATAPSSTKTPGDSAALNDNVGVYAVHMMVLRTGRVLMFSGGWEGSNLLHRSWSWDPAEPIANARGRWFMPEFDDPSPPHAGVPTRSDDPDIDLFCCHHVFLADGRLLAVGGDGAGHDNASLHVYDPVAERWEKIAGRNAPALPGVTYPTGMISGRWYPTAVVLADGAVAVFSGDAGPLVIDAEILRPPGYLPAVIAGGRRNIPGVGERALFRYPGMHLVRGGRVFYVPIAFSYGGGEAASLEQTGPTASFRMTGATSGAWQHYTNPMDVALPLVPAERHREEGTSVLLPPAQAGRILLIGGGFWDGAQHGNQRSCEILDTQASPPSWSPAGLMHHARVNVNAVLLPDGKVLILGGHDRFKWGPHTWDAVSQEHPQEQAEIYDPAVPFNPAAPSAAFTPVARMHAPRMYHSTAVLLPDARVLVAGGSDPHEPSRTPPRPTDQKHMEIYEPPYCHQGQRPVLVSISETDGPPDQIHYGREFTAQYQVEAGETIDSVVLMRPGAPTHHTDTEQRHVPLTFVPSGTNMLRVTVVNDPSVAPPGFYMVFLVDSRARPCTRALFLRLSAEHCTIVADRSHFSIDEAEAVAVGGDSEFAPAFYLIVDGFRPSQLGITTTTPTLAELATFAPAFSFAEPGVGTVANMAAYPTRMLLEVSGASLEVQQRVTFEYGLRLTGTGMFPPSGVMPELRVVHMGVNVGGHGCRADITLFRQPNPYMLDGPTHWLSTDLRVFALRPGESQSDLELPVGTPDPLAYITDFVAACDTAPQSLMHPFDRIVTDQEASRLYLETLREGAPVFNFAIARVRYRSVATVAADVRVFFRMFTTAVTSMTYSSLTYPRNAAETLPTLGVSATEVLTIPHFGVARTTVETIGDTVNTKPVPASGAGTAETHRYFGVWLDFNQSTLLYTDPNDGVLKSIQDLIRGKHQCLVAEIRFGADAIPAGASPADNDNLAQRNLAIVGSDNPGLPDSHLVQHTFDLRTTWPPKGKDVNVAVLNHVDRGLNDSGRGGDHGREQDHVHAVEPDELMIQWGRLPEDAEATLYFPALDADAIIDAARKRPGPPRLERVDAHTIRCIVADVTYVPLIAPAPTQVAGLITIRLPDTVKTGENFRVITRQIGGVPRRVLGTFELFIPVSTGDKVRPDEEHLLAVLKNIGKSIRPTSRWYPVFQRYLGGTGDKVRGLGGSPEQIEPSPTGEPGRETGRRGVRCCGLSSLVVLLAALFVVASAIVGEPGGRWAFAGASIGLAAVLVTWACLCRMSLCGRLAILAVGATVGAATLGGLSLLGALTAAATPVLALAAAAAGVLSVLALACFCARRKPGEISCPDGQGG